MPAIKLYSEVQIIEKGARGNFFTPSGKSLLQALLAVFLFNRNYYIERRISRLRRLSAATKPWSKMTDDEHISHIYRTMAEEKAIARMLKLKD